VEQWVDREQDRGRRAVCTDCEEDTYVSEIVSVLDAHAEDLLTWFSRWIVREVYLNNRASSDNVGESIILVTFDSRSEFCYFLGGG
jgi:hypothetical protein